MFGFVMVLLSRDGTALTTLCCDRSTDPQLGVVKISLREIWGAPGNALVGSWRLSDCRDDIEVTMELIWWEATSEAGLRQGFESSDSISSSLRDEDFTGIEFESDGNASARALDRHGIPTDVKSLASTSTGVR